MLFVVLVACGSKSEPGKPPPAPVASDAASIWDRPLIDADPNAPKPLVHPNHIDECNLDSDCNAMTTCDCMRCVTDNENVHVDLCEKPCSTHPCAGKVPRCHEHRCTFY